VGLAAYTTVIVGSGYHNQWPTTDNQSMQLIVSSTNTFGNIIGFNSGTFPASPTISGTTGTVASTFTPNLNPTSVVQCRLSCLYNEFSSNSQFLHLFSNQDVSIGAIIDAGPKFYSSVPCRGSHKDLYFSMYDVYGNPLGLLDSNIALKLEFKKVRNL
jgi:hypothetical protein